METFIDAEERVTLLFAVNSTGLYSSHKCVTDSEAEGPSS